jgi:adenylylsulfate kinase-like enzyme
MAKNEVIVTITGGTYAGKTTVAAILHLTLQIAELDVDIECLDDDNITVSENLQLAVDAMRNKGVKIRIIDNNGQ